MLEHLQKAVEAHFKEQGESELTNIELLKIVQEARNLREREEQQIQKIIEEAGCVLDTWGSDE